MKLQLNKNFVANVRYSKQKRKFISKFITVFGKKSHCWGKIIEILLNRDFVFLENRGAVLFLYFFVNVKKEASLCFFLAMFLIYKTLSLPLYAK